MQRDSGVMRMDACVFLEIPPPVVCLDLMLLSYFVSDHGAY